MDQNKDYQMVEAALCFLWEHYRNQPELEEIAAHVQLSPYHFQRIFQRWAGVSPKKFLQYLSLKAAKQQLRNSADLLTTSLDLGMSGPSRLHDLFITIEGMTPGEYKALGAGLEIRYGQFETLFGTCFIAATERGLCTLSFCASETILPQLAHEWPHALLLEDKDFVRAYHERIFKRGQGTSELKLFLKGTPFRLKVWSALLSIPEGLLISYSDLARRVDQPKAVRAVASAVASNSVAYLIPCHRVIRKLGGLGGYRWGIPRKLALIGWEQAVSELQMA